VIDCVIDWFDAKIQLPLEGVGTNIQNVGELNVADLPINLVNANFLEFSQTNVKIYRLAHIFGREYFGTQPIKSYIPLGFGLKIFT